MHIWSTKHSNTYMEHNIHGVHNGVEYTTGVQYTTQGSRGMGKFPCSMPFAISVIWREPTDNVSDCYFCLTKITGVTAKSKNTAQYPNLTAAMRSVPHSAELPVPKPPTNMTLGDIESSDEDVGQANINMDCDPTFAETTFSNEPHLLS